MRPNIGHTSRKPPSNLSIFGRGQRAPFQPPRHKTYQTRRRRKLLRVRERRGHEFESTSKIMQSEFSSTRDMGEGKGGNPAMARDFRMAAANCDCLVYLSMFVLM